MEELSYDRTSFVIAHLLSAIKKVDRIVVIEDIRIKEMGTPSELLRNRGALAPDLYEEISKGTRM